MLIVHFYAYWCPTRFSFQIMLLTVTRRVSHVEQELLTLPENLSSPPQWGSFYQIFSEQIVFCPFTFGQCVPCSSISDYHFGIFKLVVSGTIEQVKYINARLVSRGHEQLNTQMYIWCSEAQTKLNTEMYTWCLEPLNKLNTESTSGIRHH